MAGSPSASPTGSIKHSPPSHEDNEWDTTKAPDWTDPNPPQPWAAPENLSTPPPTPSESIAILTHLAEISIIGAPDTVLRLPFRVLYGLMQSTIGIVQELLRHRMRDEFYSRWLQHWPESPLQVGLGGDEVFEVFGEHGGYCRPRGTAKYNALKDLAGLRNDVSHQNYVTTQRIKDHLKNAQTLAVLLEDEPRAQAIHGLRMQLREELAKALSDIEAGSTKSSDPQYEWPVHHQKTSVDHVQTQDERYPEVVKTAAKEWRNKAKDPWRYAVWREHTEDQQFTFQKVRFQEFPFQEVPF